MAEDVRQEFARIRAFEWDEAKRASNLRRHLIDFVDAIRVFDEPFIIGRSDRHGEIRYQVFGLVDGREVAVVCTLRGDRCRIISARRARKDEREEYHNGVARGSAEGTN